MPLISEAYSNCVNAGISEPECKKIDDSPGYVPAAIACLAKRYQTPAATVLGYGEWFLRSGLTQYCPQYVASRQANDLIINQMKAEQIQYARFPDANVASAPRSWAVVHEDQLATLVLIAVIGALLWRVRRPILRFVAATLSLSARGLFAVTGYDIRRIADRWRAYTLRK